MPLGEPGDRAVVGQVALRLVDAILVLDRQWMLHGTSSRSISLDKTKGASVVTDLEARYGRSPRSAKRVRGIAIAAAALFVAVFAAWIWWGGLLEAPAQFEARDIAHDIISDTEVSITWQLTVQPGTSAKCALQALNKQYSIVGWRIVDVPPSDEHTRRITETVRTAEPAVNGLIYRCWLT